MDSVAKDEEQRFELGVVLVHGIGMQASGETLTRWGDALVDTIRKGTRDRVVPTIERAEFGPQSGERAQMVVRFGDHDKAPRWLLSEAWWADSFLAPRYGELVSWGLRALPWFVATHAARRYWTHRGEGWSKGLALATAFMQLLVLLALTPLLLVLLAVTLLLGLLPISQLRGVILRIQSILTATVGDSMAFVASPVRAGFIRTRILDSLKRHKQTCARTIVVAHSQGAAAVLDALGGMTKPDHEAKVLRVVNPPPEGSLPDTLLTFGAGTNQLVSQRALAGGGLKGLGINPAVYAIFALLGLAVVIWLGYVDLRAGRVTLHALSIAAGMMAITAAGAGLLGWLGIHAIRMLAVRYKGVAKRQQALMIGVFGTCSFGTMLLWVIFGKVRGYPLDSLIFGGLALLMLAGSLFMILSRDLGTVIAQWVRKPDGLHEWIDLYASADPVPNGPTETAQDGTPASRKIWNEGSLLTDHTTYWDNLDGFVLRVARACANTAGSAWAAELPNVDAAVDLRAEWRVGFLRLTRWINALLWAWFGALLWFQHHESLPLPVEIPAWLPGPMARFAALILAMAAGAWLSHFLLRWLWQRWVRTEQEAVLAGKEPSADEAGWLMVMGFVVWLLLFAVYGFGKHGWEALEALLADPKEYLMLPVLAFVYALISYFVLTRWPRPPSVYPKAQVVKAA